jgi:hypothetical protein
MNKEQYGPGIAMTDLATNLLGVFICLFMLSFLMMSKKIEEKNNKVESKAEFLITITWEKNSTNDVDTYVEDPLGNLVFFRAREKGLLHLDRDDLGTSNDKVQLSDGKTIEVRGNREIVTIRGIIPGEYVVNVHMYSERDKAEKTPVTIKLEKINPALKLITLKEVTLGKAGDEKTGFRFTLDNVGDVTSVNDLSKDLAKSQVQVPQYGAEPQISFPEYTPPANPDPETPPANPEGTP